MRFAADRSAAAAWEVLRSLLAHPAHEFWEDGFGYDVVSHRYLQGPDQVTDAWLAELARRRGGSVATLDAAFATLHHDVVMLIPPT
jgi:hypothetical protein